MEGWIKLHRKLVLSDLWLSETFTRGQAWIDMLILANHKDGFIRVRGINIAIKRGQLGWSEVKLSKRWGWSRTKTRHFLKELEKVQQIVQQKNAVSLLISIVNYDEYQKKDSKKDIKSTAEVQQKDTNKNVKNEKTNITVIFEVFIKAFPGTKRGLITEFENFIKKNKPEIVDLLLPALEKEKKHRAKQTELKEFVPPWKNLSTWINQRCWEQEFPEVMQTTNNHQSQKTPAEWLQ